MAESVHLTDAEEEGEVVLSSVHLGAAAGANISQVREEEKGSQWQDKLTVERLQATVLSEFPFTPPGFRNGSLDQGSVCFDEDGDLEVPRRHSPTTQLLVIG